MIELFTQLLSWITIPLAISGVSLTIFDVIPKQLKLFRIADSYSFERKRLPVLSVTFLVLGVLIESAIIYNMITGLNGHNIYNNTLRSLISLLVFVCGYTWASIYKERL